MAHLRIFALYLVVLVAEGDRERHGIVEDVYNRLFHRLRVLDKLGLILLIVVIVILFLLLLIVRQVLTVDEELFAAVGISARRAAASAIEGRAQLRLLLL